MRTLKQSTAYDLMVFMTDATDHVSGKTGLTLTVTASKAGSAFASISPAVTERGNGWYSLALTAAHTDTLGDLAVRATGTGADPTDMVAQVLAHVAETAAINARLPSDPADASDVASLIDALPTASENATAVRSELSVELARVDVAISSRNAIAPLDSTATQAAAAAALTAYDAATAADVAAIPAAPSAVDNAAAVRAELATELARVDVATSTRLASASYSAPDNAGISAVKAKTDNLPSDPADNSEILAAIGGISAGSGATIEQIEASTVLAKEATSAAIKSKTDNLPSDPADQSAIEAAISAIPAAPSASEVAAAVSVEISPALDSIKSDTGLIPAAL